MRFPLALLFVLVVAPLDAQIQMAPATLYPTGKAFYNFLQDFDGDGDLDVITNDQELVAVHPNLGDGTLGSRIPYLLSTADIDVRSLLIDDFNGDGFPDFVAGTREGSGSNVVRKILWVFSTGAGTYAPAASVPFPAPQNENPDLLATGDVNGDTRPDLIVSTRQYDTLYVFRNTASGGFVFAGPPIMAQECHALALADLDGDGDEDIAAGQSGAGVRIHLNNGLGTFSQGALINTGLPNVTAVAIADIDGDGDPDVTYTGFDGSSDFGFVVAAKNNGNATFGFFPSIVSQPDWFFRGCAIDDLDFDGAPEVVTVSGNPSLVAVFPFNGAGQLQTPSPFPVAPSSASPAIADLNGDGRPDIVTTSVSATELSVLMNVAPIPGSAVPYQGTGDDLALLTGIGAAPTTGPGNFVKTATAGEILSLRTLSPSGMLLGAPFALGVSLYSTAAPPTGMFGGVYLNPSSVLFLLGSGSAPFTPLLTAGGTNLSTAIPSGLTGMSAFLQSIAVSPAAVNGSYAGSDAHEIQIQ